MAMLDLAQLPVVCHPNRNLKEASHEARPAGRFAPEEGVAEPTKSERGSFANVPTGNTLRGCDLIELLAAFVGAIAGYGARLLLDIRRERSELSVARDLTRSDLNEALGAIDRALEDGWPIGNRSDWVQPWRDRRASLASGLPTDSYDTVARAYGRMHQLESALNAGRDDRALTSPDKAFLNDMNEVIGSAVAVLAPARRSP